MDTAENKNQEQDNEKIVIDFCKTLDNFDLIMEKINDDSEDNESKYNEQVNAFMHLYSNFIFNLSNNAARQFAQQFVEEYNYNEELIEMINEKDIVLEEILKEYMKFEKMISAKDRIKNFPILNTLSGIKKIINLIENKLDIDDEDSKENQTNS